MRYTEHHKKRKSAVLACAIMAAFAFVSGAFSSEVSHGKMAAAIRSADYPCAHVIALESAGEDAWSVKCNSGNFRVSRDAEGNFTVTKTD